MVSEIAGFIVLSIIGTPVATVGLDATKIFVGTGASVGTRLKALSIENGQIKRTATTAHSKHVTHFGAFLRSRRTRMTAAISQLAVILIFSTFKNTPLILTPP